MIEDLAAVSVAAQQVISWKRKRPGAVSRLEFPELAHHARRLGWRCKLTLPLGEVLLTLAVHERSNAPAVEASHPELAELMGMFGALTTEGTIRNAVEELKQIGLFLVYRFESHPEGFAARSDRRSATGAILRNPMRKPLYVLGEQLRVMADERMAARRQRNAKGPSAGVRESIRVLTVGIQGSSPESPSETSEETFMGPNSEDGKAPAAPVSQEASMPLEPSAPPTASPMVIAKPPTEELDQRRENVDARGSVDAFVACFAESDNMQSEIVSHRRETRPSTGPAYPNRVRLVEQKEPGGFQGLGSTLSGILRRANGGDSRPHSPPKRTERLTPIRLAPRARANHEPPVLIPEGFDPLAWCRSFGGDS